MKQFLSIFLFTLLLTSTIAQGTDREYLRAAIKNNVLKNYDLAIDNASKAIAINPSLTDAWYIRGYCRLMLERYKESISDFNKTIALRPDFADAYYYRGKAKMGAKDYFGALGDFNEAKKISPMNATALFFKATLSSLFTKTEGKSKP